MNNTEIQSAIRYSENDLRIALQRIEERKASQNQSIFKNSLLLSPIKRYCQNPQTFPEWAVKYLIENKNEIAKKISVELNGGGIHEISNLAMIRHIMNSYVYPYVAENLYFDCPSNNRLQRGDHRTPLDIFVDEALWEFFKDLKQYYAIYEGKYYCIKPAANKYKESLADTAGYGLTSKTLWILLEQEGMEFIGQKTNLKQIIQKVKTTLKSRFKYQLEETNENSKTPSQIFNDLGYYIFKSTSIEKTLNKMVSPRNIDSNKKIIDELIKALSGIDQYAETKPQLFFIPKFEGLIFLRDQIQTYMKQLADEGEYNQELEKHLFGPDEPIGNYINQKGLISKLRKKFSKKNQSEVQEEVKNIYKMIQYTHELYQIGITFYNNAIREKQQEHGELLVEIAMLYAERIDEVAIEVEAKLKVRKYEVKNLKRYLDSLAWFITEKNYNNVSIT